jgi:diguanylate cyclase (GGDEF)-like protein/PAS domain S-box-containing protein
LDKPLTFRLADEAVYRELSDAAHDAFVAFDRIGLIRTWNQAAARMFGYEADEVLGEPASILVPRDQAEIQHDRLARVLDGERIHSVRAEGLHRDGGTVPMTMTLVPIDGGRGGFLMARDLTEERMAQATLTEAQLRLDEAQELSHVGLWLWDAATDALQISDELYRIHGVSPLDFEGTMAAYLVLAHPDDAGTVAAALAASLESGRGLEEEYRVLRPDGSVRWIYSRAEVVTGPDGRPGGLRGVAQDVTDRKRTADSLREQASLLELLRRMAVAANEAVSLEQALRICVRDIAVHTGWIAGRVHFVGTETETELPTGIAVAVRRRRPAVERVADAGERNVVVAFPIVVAVEVVAVLQFFAATEPDPLLVTTVWDGANQLGRVAERARSRDELSHQALHDALTGLPNRSLLMNRLSHSLALQSRDPGTIALIFLDLDNFKLINDSLGHEAGDDLVVTVARRLERVLRTEDTCARFGGDEFIVLCDNLAGEEVAVDLAERILAAIAQPVSLRGHANTVVTASAGIAIAAPGAEAEALLRDADLAMYRAKEAGRGQYQIFDSEMHHRATQRLTIANELRTAVTEGQLRLVYQPQVTTSTGEMVGLEALVRWEHPERGLLLPLEFISVAEETDLIFPLGTWVLNEACRHAAAWRLEHADRPLKMSVNVSPKQLSRPELIDDVAAALALSGLDADCLCIEITESVLMSDAEFFLEALLGLKLLGVSIAIDDFGTGYSSLAYLRRFPIDVIKVDKGFVDGLQGTDAKATAVVAAVVALAHALGLTAMAEGVETQVQRDILAGLGCDECQGYYFARPAGPEVISALLAGEAPGDP